MNRVMIHRLTVAGMLMGLAGWVGCRCDDARRGLPPAEPIPASELRETQVLPHPDGPIVPGENYVYCATFQLAWNQFQDDVVGEPVQFADSPPMAQDLARHGGLTTGILPPGSFLVKAGLVQNGVVDDIRKGMAERFPDATLSLPDDLDAGDNVAVAYAYLQRALRFREAYDRLDEPLVFQSKAGATKVACFGVRNFEMDSERNMVLGEQVSILVYAGEDDFILRLNTTGADDQMVLAKVEPEETLAATVAAVRKRIDAVRQDDIFGLTSGESLVIPVIELNVLRKYTELEKQSAINAKLAGLYLGVAEQRIRFRLDEAGARLESSAHVALESKMKPIQYVLDKPFLIYLKRKSGDEPYLAMWIETPELLEKVE